jgi:hypothetical protein
MRTINPDSVNTSTLLDSAFIRVFRIANHLFVRGIYQKIMPENAPLYPTKFWKNFFKHRPVSAQKTPL